MPEVAGDCVHPSKSTRGPAIMGDGRARAAAALGRCPPAAARAGAAGGAAAAAAAPPGGAPPVQGRRRRHLVAVLPAAAARRHPRAQRAHPDPRLHAGRRPRQRQLRARGRRGGARVEGVVQPARAVRDAAGRRVRPRPRRLAVLHAHDRAAPGAEGGRRRHVAGRGDAAHRRRVGAGRRAARRRAPPRRCESGGGDDGDGAAAMPMAEARAARAAGGACSCR